MTFVVLIQHHNRSEITHRRPCRCSCSDGRAVAGDLRPVTGIQRNGNACPPQPRTERIAPSKPRDTRSSALPRRHASNSRSNGSVAGGRRTSDDGPLNASASQGSSTTGTGMFDGRATGMALTTFSGDAVVRRCWGRPAHRQAAHSASENSSAGGPHPTIFAIGFSFTPSGASTSTAVIQPPTRRPARSMRTWVPTRTWPRRSSGTR